MDLNRILRTLVRHSLPTAAFVLSVSLGGCTVVSSNTCSKASDVTGCEGAATGYSCTGSDAPEDTNPSLSCSSGTREASGPTAYCCVDSTVAICGLDSTVTCASGSNGYSCTGTDSPAADNALISCGTGVPTQTNGSTAYCCATSTTPTCSVNSTVNCASGSVGYACTGSDTPQQSDTSLTCGAGAPGTGSVTNYCCTGATACVTDTSVDCSTVVSAGVTGYTCTSGEPDSTNSSLSCVQSSNEAASKYCCSLNGICSLESSATTQCSGSTPNGYVCTGAAVPSGLTCGSAIAGTEGTTIYCCSL